MGLFPESLGCLVDKQHSSVNFVLLPEQTPAGVLTTTELHRASFSCFSYFFGGLQTGED